MTFEIENPPPSERELRTGVYRSTYERNKLIVHVPVAKQKNVHYDRPVTKDTIYGKTARQPGVKVDTAGDVMGRWQTHVPNPNTALPGPDFCKMNKLATHRGVLTPKEVRDFRKDHPLTLTRGSSAKKKDPLPSDTQPQYKYGRPSEKRLVEEIRRTGVMVPMKSLMEGQYVEEWVRTKEGIDFSKVSVPATIPRPRPTIASTSRARVAHETLGRSGAAPSITSPPGSPSRSGTADGFKMTKFGGVPPRVFDGIDWNYPPQSHAHGGTLNRTQASHQSGELETVD